MLAYGSFLTALINFLIMAFVIFLIVRWANRLLPKPETAPATPEEIVLLRDIRDSLTR